MNGTSRVTLRWPSLIAGALVFLAIGAGLAYVVMRPAPPTVGNGPSAATSASSSRPSTATPQTAPANVPSPEVSVTLTPEAIQRAGIVVVPVSSGSGSTQLRLPGVVEPNAYKQVVVTPIASGRVTRVLVELGQSVRRGQPLAEIFSPELAEVETRFVSARAELDAHERELQRTEKLVEIGAASRQELERLHAEHTAKLTAVESARSRLELLGLSASAIASLGPGQGCRRRHDRAGAHCRYRDGARREFRAQRRYVCQTVHGCRSLDGLGGRRCLREGFLPRSRRHCGEA